MSKNIPTSPLIETIVKFKTTAKKRTEDKAKRELKGQHTIGAEHLEDPMFVSSGQEYESHYTPEPLSYIDHDDVMFDSSQDYLKKITGYEKFLYPIRQEFGDFVVDFSTLVSNYIKDHKQEYKKNFFTKITADAAKNGTLTKDNTNANSALKTLNDLFNNKLPMDASGINPKNIYTNLQYIEFLRGIVFPLIIAQFPEKKDKIEGVISKLNLSGDQHMNSGNREKVVGFGTAMKAVGPALVSFFSSLVDEAVGAQFKTDLRDYLESFSDSIIKADESGVYDNTPEGLAALAKLISPTIFARGGKVSPVVLKNIYYTLVSSFAGGTALPYLQLDKSSNEPVLTSDAKNALYDLKSAVEKTAIGNKGDFFPAFGGTKAVYFWGNYRKAKDQFIKEFSTATPPQSTEVADLTTGAGASGNVDMVKMVQDIYMDKLAGIAKDFTDRFKEDFEAIDEYMGQYFNSSYYDEAESIKASLLKTLSDLNESFTDELRKYEHKASKLLTNEESGSEYFNLSPEVISLIQNTVKDYEDDYKEEVMTSLYEVIKTDATKAKKLLTMLAFPEIDTIAHVIQPHLDEIKALVQNIPHGLIVNLNSQVSEIVALDKEIKASIGTTKSDDSELLGKIEKLDSLISELKTTANTVTDQGVKASFTKMIEKITELYGQENVLARVNSAIDASQAELPDNVLKMNDPQLRQFISRWIPSEKSGESNRHERFSLMPLTSDDLRKLALFIVDKDRNKVSIYLKNLKLKDHASPIEKKRAEAIKTLMNWISPVATGSMKQMTLTGHEVRYGYDVYRKGQLQTSGQAFKYTLDAIRAFLGHESKVSDEHTQQDSNDFKNTDYGFTAPVNPLTELFTGLSLSIKAMPEHVRQALESGDAEKIAEISDKELLDVFTSYHGSKNSVLDILASYFTFTEKGNDPESVHEYYEALRLHKDALSVGNDKIKQPSLEKSPFGKVVAKTIKQMAANKTLFRNPTVTTQAPFNADANIKDAKGNLLPPFASKVINLLLSLEPREIDVNPHGESSAFFPEDGNLKKVSLASTTSQRSGLLNRILDADVYPPQLQADPVLILEFQYKIFKTIAAGLNKFLIPELEKHKESLNALMSSETLKIAKDGGSSIFTKETREDILKAYDKLVEGLNSSLVSLVGSSNSFLDSHLKTIYLFVRAKNIAPQNTMGLDELEKYIMGTEAGRLELNVLDQIPIFKKIQALKALLSPVSMEQNDQIIGLFKALSNVLLTSVSYLVTKRAIIAASQSTEDQQTIKLLDDASKALDTENEDILHMIYGGPSNPDKFKEALEDPDKLKQIKAFSYSHLKAFMSFIVDDLKRSSVERKAVEIAKEQEERESADEAKKDSFFNEVNFALEFSTLDIDSETATSKVANITIPKEFFKTKIKDKEAKEILTTKGKKVAKAGLTTEQQEQLNKLKLALQGSKERFIPNKKLEKQVIQFLAKWESFLEQYSLNQKAVFADFFPNNGFLPDQESFEKVFIANRRTSVKNTTNDRGEVVGTPIPVPSKDEFYNKFKDIVLGSAGRDEDFSDIVTCVSASMGGAKHFILAVQGKTGKVRSKENTVLAHGERNLGSIKGQSGNRIENVGDSWLTSTVSGEEVERSGLLVKAETLAEQYATHITEQYPKTHEFYSELSGYIAAIQALPKYFNLISHCANVATNHTHDINSYKALKAKASELFIPGHLQMLPVVEGLKYVKNYKTKSLPKEGLSEGVEEPTQAPVPEQPVSTSENQPSTEPNLSELEVLLNSGAKVSSQEVTKFITKTNAFDVLDIVLRSSLSKENGLIDAIDSCTSTDSIARGTAISQYISAKSPSEPMLVRLLPSQPGAVLRAIIASNIPLTPNILSVAGAYRPITAGILRANHIEIPKDWPAAERGLPEPEKSAGGGDEEASLDPLDQAKFYIIKSSPQIPELFTILYGTNSLKGVQIQFITEDGDSFTPEDATSPVLSIITNAYQILSTLAVDLV